MYSWRGQGIKSGKVGIHCIDAKHTRPHENLVNTLPLYRPRWHPWGPGKRILFHSFCTRSRFGLAFSWAFWLPIPLLRTQVFSLSHWDRQDVYKCGYLQFLSCLSCNSLSRCFLSWLSVLSSVYLSACVALRLSMPLASIWACIQASSCSL